MENETLDPNDPVLIQVFDLRLAPRLRRILDPNMIRQVPFRLKTERKTEKETIDPNMISC